MYFIITIIIESDVHISGINTELQVLEFLCSAISSRFPLSIYMGEVSEGICAMPSVDGTEHSSGCVWNGEREHMSQGTFRCACCAQVSHPICTGTMILTMQCIKNVI